jgi:hypothetical protein
MSLKALSSSLTIQMVALAPNAFGYWRDITLEV